MKRTICDRCKADVVAANGTSVVYGSVPLDLCGDCGQSFRKWLKGQDMAERDVAITFRHEAGAVNRKGD